MANSLANYKIGNQEASIAENLIMLSQDVRDQTDSNYALIVVSKWEIHWNLLKHLSVRYVRYKDVDQKETTVL